MQASRTSRAPSARSRQALLRPSRDATSIKKILWHQIPTINQGQVEHAMFARVQIAPPPKLTVQSIYGQNSRTDLVNSKTTSRQWMAIAHRKMIKTLCPRLADSDVSYPPSDAHGITYNYPTPVIPGGDDGAGPMADNMHDSPRVDKNDIDSSIQEPMVTTSKLTKRSESAMPRTTTHRAPRSGTSAPTGGNASGNKHDLRTLLPSTATKVSAVWPPLSAPGATIYDQHGATSIPAATSPRGDGSAVDCADM
jgi:hypothetical protein